MDENMIHRYISESPFFDYSTKNGLFIDQAKNNWQNYNTANNRKLLENEMRKLKGDEYMIVGEPQLIQSGEGAGQKNGMWVVRKQHRDRVRTVDGRMEEELTTLGTYYLVGENMYQAPSVGDVVGNRLVAATTSLSKFFDTAANLPTFSPTSGYSYLPHTTTSKPTATSATGSASVSPARSREGSVVPGADTQSLRSGSLLPESQQCSNSHTQDSRLLARSFQTYLEFGDEYMDENLLIGEPGNFSFTHSAAAVKKRRADEEAAAAAAAKAKEQQAASKVATPVGKTEQKPPSPPTVMTSDAKASKERRGSRMEKMKRKKSRPSVIPSTPGGGSGAGSVASAGGVTG